MNSTKTVKQLRVEVKEVAKQKNLVRYSKLKKAQILDLLSKKDQDSNVLQNIIDSGASVKPSRKPRRQKTTTKVTKITTTTKVTKITTTTVTKIKIDQELAKPSGRAYVRVRELLVNCRDLKPKLRGKMFNKKIPDDLKTTAYPGTIVKLLPGTYSNLGFLVEWMLEKKKPQWTDFKRLLPRFGKFDSAAVDKALTNKSSQRFLETIQGTAELLHKSFGGCKPLYDQAIQLADVVGHPDIMVCKPDGIHIYEIKYTGKLKAEYVMFMLQLFCYGAISTESVQLHLVLANQQRIISWNTSVWKKRQLFTETLADFSKQQSLRQSKPDRSVEFMALRRLHNIGYHVSKKPGQKFETLIKSLQQGPPMQTFLSGNIGTKLTTIPVEQLVAVKSHLISFPKTLFFHAPYTINLAMKPDTMDNYFTISLSYHLQVGKMMGFQGVVVHTGRATKGKGYTIDNMIANVWRVLPDASPECPLLIETPAHQGSELLNTPEELASFMMTFYRKNPLGSKAYMKKILGVCIDTCHVFAAGYQPSEYLNDFTGLLATDHIKLFHLNDSYYPIGSHKDRHYPPGSGEIPWDEIVGTIEFATKHSIPILQE